MAQPQLHIVIIIIIIIIIIVVGAGFGGLTCTQALRHAPVRITLIDRKFVRPAKYVITDAFPDTAAQRKRNFVC